MDCDYFLPESDIIMCNACIFVQVSRNESVMQIWERKYAAACWVLSPFVDWTCYCICHCYFLWQCSKAGLLKAQGTYFLPFVCTHTERKQNCWIAVPLDDFNMKTISCPLTVILASVGNWEYENRLIVVSSFFFFFFFFCIWCLIMRCSLILLITFTQNCRPPC